MPLDLKTIDLSAIDMGAALFEIDKADAEESLSDFIRQAWHVVEPSQPYVHGWHIDFICDHLEAITNGVEVDHSPYNRLLINVPPGTMKSLIVNVFWPSWEWGPRNMPHMRYVCAAHKVENLSARDSRRMRQLITSDWYKERWGDRVSLSRDQNEKLNFVNNATGFRIATAITSLTGIRGDRVIIDDPHSVDSASSDTQRETEVTTFLEAVPSRLNNPKASAIVVVMQRLHEEDVSGIILDKQLGYDHIMLPMRFDPLRAAPTKLGAEDPREVDGELLFPERFPLDVVDRDERAMGPYATAGQFQQTPEPRGGGIIKRDWWQLWDGPEFPPFDYIIASVDTAYTEKTENDYSAMTVWGVFTADTKVRATKTILRDGTTYDAVMSSVRSYSEQHPRVMMMHAWQERLPLHQLVNKIASTCRTMKVDKMLLEGKASGLSVAQEIRRLYGHENFAVQIVDPKSQDKISRLYSVQHLFAEGMVHAPDRTWADMTISQCTQFPKAKHDDLVDTVSQALRHLRTSGLLTRSEENIAAVEDSMRFQGKAPAPLYPA
jgi:predicted phage terminase large subunit-like protein